jgi:hypothetical protein
MARVNFVRDFDYYPLFPSKSVLIPHKAGEEYTVTRKCADEAIAAGAGIEVKPPARRKKAANG